MSGCLLLFACFGAVVANAAAGAGRATESNESGNYSAPLPRSESHAGC